MCVLYICVCECACVCVCMCVYVCVQYRKMGSRVGEMGEGRFLRWTVVVVVSKS